ncbi:sensor histidine kinase [Pseudonocardiaceae bacterium YIM PH 21723]|nr:sensor histidine kinase [Pseudonocardiaceae bacterium YIM PH 21723]
MGPLVLMTTTNAGNGAIDRQLAAVKTGGRAWLVDTCLALLLCFLDLFFFSDYLAKASYKAPVPAETLAIMLPLTVAAFATLWWRRRYPVPVFAVMWLLSVGCAIGYVRYWPALGVAAGVFAVAAYSGARQAWAVLGLAVLDAVVLSVRQADFERQQGAGDYATMIIGFLALYLLIYTACFAVGRWRQRSRRLVESLEERRERSAREAVQAERTRIARELHDIVAHSVTVMVLQAAGARKVLNKQPDKASEALEHIEQFGQQAIGELRRLLGVLRASGALPDTTASTGIGRGLADLDRMLADIRQTGIIVRSQISGDPVPLDTSVDLAAFRLIQESLTNVSKHAGPGASALVELDWQPGRLVVRVTDDGGGTSPREQESVLSTGQGLLGLHERVMLIGGRLIAEPVEGGFRVSASLPVAGAVSPEDEG